MTAAQGPQSLAFRVMRLCKPSFYVDPPLCLDPMDLLAGEDILDDPDAMSSLPPLIARHVNDASDSDLSYRARILLNHPSDSIGLPGLLLLPQSFGGIYLGETFCSYISVNNSSNFEIRDVLIKAEIQTERQRILLLDTSKSPVDSIRAGGRYDFVVEHDVKELGAHTLVCTALYNDGDGERKYLPQFFKFVVANPLSVRTKVRVVKETTFLEACIENHTKSNLYMDQVEFEPAHSWTAITLPADGNHPEKDSLTKEVFKPPVLIRSGGGIQNYLYQLKPSTHTQGSGQAKVQGTNVLGKLQITWRTNLGESGRLQTQQIVGAPINRKEIELRVIEVPSRIFLDKPFSIHLNLTNQSDRQLGPLEVSLSHNGPQMEDLVIMNGLQALNLIATKLGVQRIAGITVFDTREKKTYEQLLPDIEVSQNSLGKPYHGEVLSFLIKHVVGDAEARIPRTHTAFAIGPMAKLSLSAGACKGCLDPKQAFVL